MLDSIYHMTLRLLCNRISGISLCTQRCYGRHFIHMTLPENLYIACALSLWRYFTPIRDAIMIKCHLKRVTALVLARQRTRILI